MNVRAWSVSLLLFLSTVTAVGQTVNRYLNTPLPKEWEESGEVFQQTLPVDDHWWKSFQDTRLDSLIALAVDRNYSVAMAINRIAAARANLWAERGNFFPSIGLNAGWTRQETSGNTSTLPQSTDHYYDAALSMSWEIDVFGSIRKRVKAQKENFAASKEEYAAVMVSLASEVASAYINLRELQQELEVVNKNVASQEEVLKITEVRYNTGLVAKLDVAAERTGLDGEALVRCSRLSAKVDNTAVQDGFQLYLHSFVVTAEGDWAVIQQGMNPAGRMARRYHWLSSSLESFTQEPHASVCGLNQGLILNLTHREAAMTKEGILELTRERPDRLLHEAALVMPCHHEVTAGDVDLKRLGAALILAHESEVADFESLLLLPGVGPRTLQSLTLVSEVIHGTPSRFTDPARFSFAHGGKNGHPFPVPTEIYDRTIEVLDRAIHSARLGERDKTEALKHLSRVSVSLERGYEPGDYFDKYVEQERRNAWRWGGKTVYGDAKPPDDTPPEAAGSRQLTLW